MTKEQQQDVKALITFYEADGRDWSSAAEYLMRKYNGYLNASHCRCCRYEIARKAGERKKEIQKCV